MTRANKASPAATLREQLADARLRYAKMAARQVELQGEVAALDHQRLLIDGDIPKGKADAVADAERALEDGAGTVDLAASLDERRRVLLAVTRALPVLSVRVAALERDLLNEQISAHREQIAKLQHLVFDALIAIDDAIVEGRRLGAEIEQRAGVAGCPELVGTVLPYDLLADFNGGHIREMVERARRDLRHAEERESDLHDPKSDQSMNILLLASVNGVGRVGEVVRLAGRVGRDLIRGGKAEPTTGPTRLQTLLEPLPEVGDPLAGELVAR